MNVLDAKGVVRNMNTTIKVLLGLSLLWGCGSGQIVPTSDKCTIKKHWKDSLYQVLINGSAINKHWYLQEDAIDISKNLASKNKCMS
jgi:hypothetical protein